MDNYAKFYEELNPNQRRAVDTISGPVLVLAGPGTGKTQLLSVRAASILRRTDTSPENILILTYTNSAAKAMKERLAGVIGREGYDVEVGTFHSFANSLIQNSAEAANYIGERILMDEVDRVKAVEYILDNTDGIDNLRPFRAPYTYVGDILARFSDLKKDDVSPTDLEKYLKNGQSHYRSMEENHIKRLKAFSVIYKRYEELKEPSTKGVFDERGRYDFDDMIMSAVRAVRNESTLRKECLDRYSFLMVDEYQDTNGSQLDLLFELAPDAGANICCVGDDDQSIYRFQGASVDNFKRLKEKFPGIVTIALTDNYRSSENLITASKNIIELISPEYRVEDKRLKSAGRRKEKEISYREFTTEEEELIHIVDRVKNIKENIAHDESLSADERMHPYNNIAVLLRKREQILKVVDAFLQSGIPYATDGKEDISPEKRVGQLMDVIQLAHTDLSNIEAKDAFLYRVLTSDYFGIPQVDILKFLSFANKRKALAAGGSTILAEFLSYFGSNRSDIALNEPEKFKKAFDVIKRLLADASATPVHTLLLNYIKDAGIYPYILREYSDNGILRIRQLRSIGSFVNMIKAGDLSSPAMRLDEFAGELNTRKIHGIPVQGNLVTLSQEGVRVYTAHGSKGLEFHSVIIPFCIQDKNWPARLRSDRIPFPSDLFRGKKEAADKDTQKKLFLQDEVRLFYVAMTRAKVNLILTASPSDRGITTFYLDRIGMTKGVERREAVDETALIGKYLDLTGLKDPFTGTDEVLRDMISNMSLNPTRLNNYISCRRKFLYNDVLKLPGLKKKSLIFGNCVHKALEEVYKKFLKEGRFPAWAYFEKSFRGELRFQGVDKAMERDCLNRMKTLEGWFDAESAGPVMPLSLEQKLRVTIGDNIIFTGKYDKVEWENKDAGTVRIIDYKTGKPDDHLRAMDKPSDLSSPDCEGYLRQLVAYKLLYEKDRKASGGRKVSSGTLVFIEPVSANIGRGRGGFKKGQYANKTVAISGEMVDSLEKVIKDSWNNIKELRFEKLEERDKDICGNCDYDDICWGRL
ncbi:MAG: ATP-dependent helicase [Candidatus Omnitrophica bacterium]|nr:ATP-dependent helicase [Candidatus Omnitrophota bacterium]